MTFQAKTSIAVAVVLALVIMTSLAQEVSRRRQVQREVAHLNEEVRQLDGSIIELQNLNQYFRTDDYQERLAREKLGYQAPGEQVVLIPEEGSARPVAKRSPGSDVAVQTNLEKWWRVFFVDEV